MAKPDNRKFEYLHHLVDLQEGEYIEFVNEEKDENGDLEFELITNFARTSYRRNEVLEAQQKLKDKIQRK